MFTSIDDIRARLEGQRYIASDEIATVVFLAERLGKPVLAEGPAGVGKTELAKAWAAASGRDLIRLQCYEGLDETKALYEWEYAKQLLYTQLLRDALDELPAGRRDLLLLLLEDPPIGYEEISRRLGIPIGSIGPTRARALDQLRRTRSLRGLGPDLVGGERS